VFKDKHLSLWVITKLVNNSPFSLWEEAETSVKSVQLGNTRNGNRDAFIE
jgi:hypothetical protein